MRRLIKNLPLVLFVGAVLGYLQLLSNNQFIAGMDQVLRSQAFLKIQERPNVDQELMTRARTTVERYIKLINERHLLDGMIVDRDFAGDPLAVCDSLLFSSLYYVSLKKLGYEHQADRTWQAIQASQSDGIWYRHPQCKDHATSKDMIIGLLAGLSQKPQNHRQHFNQFLQVLDRNSGYFGKGPIYLSYLLPGLAEVTRKMAILDGKKHSELPDSVRRSYSTMVFDSFWSAKGYRSHLVGMLAWLEMELGTSYDQALQIRSAAETLDPFVRPFTFQPVYKQRLTYITHNLFDTDPKNLFFRYLRLRAGGGLNLAVKQDLLRELLAMQAFPKYRLPWDCDRRADYLWQRDSTDYQKSPTTCQKEFAGVDFLWLAALLLEDIEQNTTI